MKYVVLKTKK